MKLEYIVKKEDKNNDIKHILKEKLYVSSNLLKKLKATNSIFSNNNFVYTNIIPKENDTIVVDFDNMNEIIYNDKLCVYYTEKFLDKYQAFDIPLDILYEDEYLIVLNKPAGIAIHPSCDNYTNTFSNAVASYLKKEDIYSMHIITRLDKNTSGICVFAKNEYIQELFIRKKDRINFKKNYLAIVNNIIENENGIIEHPIARKQNTIILREVNLNGDYAKTEYKVLKRNIDKNYTIVEILLHTGRTHQIRVHMSYIGHPLLGDDLYSSDSNIQKYITRQALHAYKISFNHPITDKEIKLTAKIPQDIQNLI